MGIQHLSAWLRWKTASFLACRPIKMSHASSEAHARPVAHLGTDALAPNAPSTALAASTRPVEKTRQTSTSGLGQRSVAGKLRYRGGLVRWNKWRSTEPSLVARCTSSACCCDCCVEALTSLRCVELMITGGVAQFAVPPLGCVAFSSSPLAAGIPGEGETRARGATCANDAVARRMAHALASCRLMHCALASHCTSRCASRSASRRSLARMRPAFLPLTREAKSCLWLVVSL